MGGDNFGFLVFHVSPLLPACIHFSLKFSPTRRTLTLMSPAQRRVVEYVDNAAVDVLAPADEVVINIE